MTKKIIFDVFGVLLSPGFDSAADELALLLNRTVQDIRPVYERWEIPFDLGSISESRFWREVQKDLATDIAWQSLNDAVLRNYKPIRGAFELLDRCTRTADVYLLSNTRREWFEALDRNFGITRRVKRAFLSYDMGLAKPDIRCFNYIMSALECRAAELYFIDDKLENVISAQRVGIDSLHFIDSSSTEARLRLRFPSLLPPNEDYEARQGL